MAEYLELVLPIVRDDGKATPYFEDYLFQIIQGLGGEGSTTIETSIINSEEAARIPYLVGTINRLAKRIGSLESDLSSYKIAHQVAQLQIDTAGYIAKSITTNYTAKNNEWLEVSNSATITAPENAIKNNRFRLSIADNKGIKLISASSNIKIRGELTNSVLFRTAGESFDFHYFGNYWLVT